MLWASDAPALARSAGRVVRVLPDEPAIDKTFDYLVPESFGDQVRVGTRVRIALAGRRVGGWIVAVDVSPPPGVTPRPLAKLSGYGPPGELIDLAHWAAWRWAGRAASFLRTANPERVVTALPRPAPRPPATADPLDPLIADAFALPPPTPPPVLDAGAGIGPSAGPEASASAPAYPGALPVPPSPVAGAGPGGDQPRTSGGLGGATQHDTGPEASASAPAYLGAAPVSPGVPSPVVDAGPGGERPRMSGGLGGVDRAVSGSAPSGGTTAASDAGATRHGAGSGDSAPSLASPNAPRVRPGVPLPVVGAGSGGERSGMSGGLGGVDRAAMGRSSSLPAGAAPSGGDAEAALGSGGATRHGGGLEVGAGAGGERPPGSVSADAGVGGAGAAPAAGADGPVGTSPSAGQPESGGGSAVRLAPAEDPYPVVRAAAGLGNALVICPTVALARSMGMRLRRDGVGVAFHPRDWAAGAAGATVIGTRAAAWAPVADLAAVVVLDEHDESHAQEQAPTWHARDVVAERARRAGVPCVLVSPCPSLEALRWGRLLAPSRHDERAGWPVVDVVDRRQDDPRTGLLSPRLVDLLRSDRRVVCVLNRTGRAKLLACAACGELARCEACDAALTQAGDEGTLACPRCATTRPVVCAACGGTRLKLLRQGVSRVREELEAMVGEPVDEVSSLKDGAVRPATRVVVGTEAVLHQVDRADAVAFLDLDQELLAPRYRTVEQALALLARAARLVGGKAGGGRLLLQTRVPRHEVVQAVLHGDPARVAAAEADRRALLRFPPAWAMAEVSGPAAPAYIDTLRATLADPGLADPRSADAPTHRPPDLWSSAGGAEPPPWTADPGGSVADGRGAEPGEVEILGPADGRWLVRAPDHTTLCDALARVPRPPGRLRLSVDPLRV